MPALGRWSGVPGWLVSNPIRERATASSTKPGIFVFANADADGAAHKAEELGRSLAALEAAAGFVVAAVAMGEAKLSAVVQDIVPRGFYPAARRDRHRRQVRRRRVAVGPVSGSDTGRSPDSRAPNPSGHRPALRLRPAVTTRAPGRAKICRRTRGIGEAMPLPRTPASSRACLPMLPAFPFP